ncbi:hypothetical protein [Paenibacillus sp. TY11]|uniref:hypothetical protein n=1 Tax=Paenibacillus sp. TY11 TaxID=3448633 RepID=UPI00403A019B
MEYVIKNTICPEKISMLKALKNYTPINFFVDDAGEFVLSVFIESPVGRLLIKNNAREKSDGDEYPNLEIEKVNVLEGDVRKMFSGETIKDILIIREKAIWKRNCDRWIVESDVGIRMIFKDKELLLVAHDSLAGLLKLFQMELENSRILNESLKEYWSMKTDNLTSLKREEIFVW